MKWMRPKFTIANLLLLTAVVAMAAQMYRSHIQFQELKAELALHTALRAQTHLVRRCELELQAANHQLEPELQMAALYQSVGLDSANTRLASMKFTLPIGTRHAVAQVRNAELRLVRERDRLQQLERRLRIGGKLTSVFAYHIQQPAGAV